MESNAKKKINRELPPGATPLSPEDLEGLIPKYITTRSELNDAEFKNITEASKKYFLSRKRFPFTIGNLYKVHKEMFGQVWKWAGRKRITEKNIGVEKTQIDVEIKKSYIAALREADSQPCDIDEGEQSMPFKIPERYFQKVLKHRKPIEGQSNLIHEKYHHMRLQDSKASRLPCSKMVHIS